MRDLSFYVRSNNIDLKALFLEKGYNHKTELKFKHFKQFLLTIDSTLTNE
jgi:hypothetical protein